MKGGCPRISGLYNILPGFGGSVADSPGPWVERDLLFGTCQRALDESISEKKQWGPQGAG